jgi:DNA modification methylase
MSQLQIQNVATSKLKINPNNVRTHPKRQIDKLAEVIRRIGFIVPIVANATLVVLAGHGRLAAAKQLGRKLVPVIIVDNLSDAEMRLFALADNKLAQMSGYDGVKLAAELQELAPLLSEINIDFHLTGFETPELDRLFGDLSDPEADPADTIPPMEKAAVTHQNDLWFLGDHRLLCGDAMQAQSHQTVMAGEYAATVITDPPYNVRISSVQGRGKIKHPNFAQASGEMSRAEFTAFLRESLGHAADHSRDGAIHYIFMDWRHMTELFEAGALTYSELKMLVVWAKTNAGMGTFYRSQHELIFVYKVGAGDHINNFALGQHGRSRSNVWTYAGANTFRAGRQQDLEAHPTVKPVAMIADSIRDCSHRGDIVLDPFLGSGTAILAAERVGRRGYGIELDPLYVDTAIRRWQDYTKKDAILVATGQTFDEIAVDGRRTKRGRRA